jgi:hypothetical protein
VGDQTSRKGWREAEIFAATESSRTRPGWEHPHPRAMIDVYRDGSRWRWFVCTHDESFSEGGFGDTLAAAQLSAENCAALEAFLDLDEPCPQQDDQTLDLFGGDA